MNSKVDFLKFNLKTTLIGVVFCLATAHSLAVPKTENYSDLISKAQNLILQKDRLQAMNVLVAGIKKENSKSNAYLELKKNIEDLSQVFISEKAQQLYELAITLKKTDMTASTQKITEALRLEPDHLKLIIELSRNQITKGDCSSAQESLSKIIQLSPYIEELKLLQTQIYLCLNQMSELNQIRSTVDIKKSNYASQWILVDIEKFDKLGQNKAAIDSLILFKNLKLSHPEVNYWSWKLNKNTNDGYKYVNECKKMSTGAYRQYLMDPQLCRRLSEVESELKNVPNQSE
jgi:hypothetical protein